MTRPRSPRRLTRGAALLGCVAVLGLPGCLDALLGLGEDDAPPAVGPDATVDETDLCAPCLLGDQCGDGADRCLANRETHERFCGADCSAALCPEGFGCQALGSEGGQPVRQCVPAGLTCDPVAPECPAGCASTAGLQCARGHCLRAGAFLEERALCLELVNAYRGREGAPPLGSAADLEACAAEAAEVDGETGQPHSYFQNTGGCGYVATSEIEIPGWSLGQLGTVDAVVDYGIGTFMATAPQGAEYLTLMGAFGHLGCGVHVTPEGGVWLVLQLR